jgi:hypothetical protein
MSRNHYFRWILLILDFSPNISEKYSYFKFRENPPSGSIVLPRGQTLEFWERAYRKDPAHSKKVMELALFG